MAAGPYNPVSFTSESLTREKLQQMANNQQWLFENSPRIRYNSAGIVRESGLKIIAGRTPYAPTQTDVVNVDVYFGSFFNAACKPVVSANVDPTYGRKDLTINGLNPGSEIDHRGFRAHLFSQEVGGPGIFGHNGWVHWIAVGF